MQLGDMEMIRSISYKMEYYVSFQHHDVGMSGIECQVKKGRTQNYIFHLNFLKM